MQVQSLSFEQKNNPVVDNFSFLNGMLVHLVISNLSTFIIW